MPRLLIALALFAGLISLAPALAAPVPKDRMQQNPGYWPTKVGTKLVYDVNGVEVTRVVAKVENVQGGMMVTTETVLEDDTTCLYMKMLVTPKGLFLTEQTGCEYDSPWCIFRLPHETGETWDATVVPSQMKAKKEELVKTPAGEFTAAVVELELNLGGRKTMATYWYARGVGIVRCDTPDGSAVLKACIPGKD